MRNERIKSRITSIAYWATTILGPASFVIGGVVGLTGSEQSTAALSHLGYPAYFGLMLGACKLAGAVVTVIPGVPRLKEWAYAGFFFDLTAAAVSHAAVGDSAGDIVAPLVFLALVAASYVLRPAGRRLAGATAPRASADVHSATGSDAGLRVRTAA